MRQLDTSPLYLYTNSARVLRGRVKIFRGLNFRGRYFPQQILTT